MGDSKEEWRKLYMLIVRTGGTTDGVHMLIGNSWNLGKDGTYCYHVAEQSPQGTAKNSSQSKGLSRTSVHQFEEVCKYNPETNRFLGPSKGPVVAILVDQHGVRQVNEESRTVYGYMQHFLGVMIMVNGHIRPDERESMRFLSDQIDRIREQYGDGFVE